MRAVRQEKKPELLAPAGDLEKLKMALLYGADAVYLGGSAYGLRALGGDFSRDALRSAVAMAHGQGKKVYVTVNVYPHNEELADLPGYLRHLAEIGADAILVSDLGVFSMARETVPTLPVHISTQANTVNWAAAEAWRKLGAARVVLAREMSLAEILEVRRKTTVELELFVHGAMCISYSGRCLISSYLTGRDANRGNCAQPCRWRYHVVEEERPGEVFPVEEDEHGTYFFNSKDLCLLPHLAKVMASGVDSLKIEGRMKSVHYVASVVKTYREAIDTYFRDPAHFSVRPAWLSELDKVSHRAYTAGFFRGETGATDQIYGTSSYQQTSVFVGVVEGYDPMSGWADVEQRNHIKAGEEIEVLSPQGDPFRQTIEEMRDDAGAVIAVAPHAQQKIRIKMKENVAAGSILRRPLEKEEKSMTVRHAGRAVGRVQGVGFRAFVEGAARDMGFTGWVKNMPDGSVAMEVQGDEADFPALTARIAAGNDWIQVQDLTWEPRSCVLDEKAFTIRR